MTRVEPHNAVCPECGGLLIEISNAHVLLRLDATPDTAGDWRAYCDREGQWRANPSSLTEDSFLGMRRREHVCVIPDKQLELA